MSALCLYVCGLMVHPPVSTLQGGAKNCYGDAKKILLATSHPPDQKSETAPGRSNDSLPPTNPTPRSKLCKEVN